MAASLALQDFAYNLASRYPQVNYFGPINEPNVTSNYNPPGGFTGNYLNYYMQYLVWPVSSGIKEYNSVNKLVGPDVGLTAGAASGLNSFISPLHQYFSSSFDVWSVHDYSSDHNGTKNNMDSVFGIVGYSAPVWLTEVGYSASNLTDQSNNITGLYVDRYNRSYYWPRAFYHSLQDQSYGLKDQYGNFRPSFYNYQTLYGR